MKNEIAKRKKRFLAISIILTLLLCNLTPFTVFAETYTNFQLTSTPMYEPDKQNLVNAGDILQLFGGKNPQTYNGNYAIQYLDTNESPLHLELTPEANRHNEADWYYETQVLDYSSAGGTAIPAKQFKCWQVTYLYVSAGWSGEITLKAIPYSASAITYELDGGVNSPANPSVYYEGKADIPLENATKSGYSFDGWYTDAAFSTQITAISAEQTGDVTLYAKFTPNPVVSSITYVLDGGSNGEGNPDSYTEGSGVPSFSDASKSGYSFDGWFSDASFTNKVTSISPEQTGDVTLYAKFTFIPVVSSITYVLDGGSNGEGNPDSYTEGSGVPSFSDASKSGYSFDGWFSDAAFTNKVTSISPEQTGDVTLYAKFTFIPVVSSITYVLDVGSNGEGNPDSYTEGSGVPSFSDASKSGYSFDGWFSDASFTNKVTSISPEQTGDVTLYAKFTLIPLPTQNLTQTPTPVPTQTPTSVPTQTPPPIPTQTPTPIPTQTPTPVPTQTLTPVSTQTPTSVPTQTPIPAEQKENSYPPKTADRAPIIPLLFIMGISSTVAMMTILLRRKREK